MTPQLSTQDVPAFELLGPEDGCLTVVLKGNWRTDHESTADLYGAVSNVITDSSRSERYIHDVAHVRFDSAALTEWGSRLLVQVAAVLDASKQLHFELDVRGLPSGIRRLLRLAREVPPQGERRHRVNQSDFLTAIGLSATRLGRSLSDANQFFGESLLSLARFVRGTARYLRSDVVEFLQATGPQALPIVGIISVLMGVILGFMGAVQLQQFGAEIYVANLVALGQTREIAPMMTAIIMAGRTGAAYAAQLGSMRVNEEIDALTTFGFSPMDFLVLPRMVALAVMFPFLVLYADALGIFGGYLVGVGMLGLGTIEYFEQTRQAIGMTDVVLGLVKGSVFGILVAVTGCMKGMQSGRSASAVGDATTQAVVAGIIAIIVMTAVFSVLTNVLGI